MKRIKFIILGVLTLCLSLIGVAQVSAAEENEKDDDFVISFEIFNEETREYDIIPEFEDAKILGLYKDGNSEDELILEFEYSFSGNTIYGHDVIEKLRNYFSFNDYNGKYLFKFFIDDGSNDEGYIIEKELMENDRYTLELYNGLTAWLMSYSYINHKYENIVTIKKYVPFTIVFSESSSDDFGGMIEDEMSVGIYNGNTSSSEAIYVFNLEACGELDPGCCMDYHADDFYDWFIENIDINKVDNYYIWFCSGFYSEEDEEKNYGYYLDGYDGSGIPLSEFLHYDENGNVYFLNCIILSYDYSIGEYVGHYVTVTNKNNITNEKDYLLYTAEELEAMKPTPDTEAPKIYGTKEYTVSTKTQYSIDTIKGALFAEDNSGEEVEVKLFSDYYSENYQTPGTYYVTFFATDSSGNTTTFSVKINVKDTQAPVFYDKDGKEVSSTTVHKSLDSVLLISEVMDKMTVTDDVDGEITTVSIVKDNYTGYGDEAGTYTIVVRAKDAAGNKTDFTIYVYVLDSMPDKTLIIDKHHVVVENNVKLTSDNIAAILKTCGYYKANTTSYVTINLEAYTELYETNGEYLVEYNIVTTSGTETNGVLTVEVVDARASDNTIVEEEPNLFKKVLNWIWEFIKKIFTFIADLFSGKLFK